LFVARHIEHETAKRRKPKKANADADSPATKSASKKAPKLNKQPIKTDEVVPVGAVDMTPVDDGDEE